jgi:hypothetical protein
MNFGSSWLSPHGDSIFDRLVKDTTIQDSSSLINFGSSWLSPHGHSSGRLVDKYYIKYKAISKLSNYIESDSVPSRVEVPS